MIISDATATVTPDWRVSSPEEGPYGGWVSSAISPLSAQIDLQVNPRDHYVDLQDISDGPGGTTLYVARVVPDQHERLALPADVRERDERDFLAGRPTFVALKSVPILPTGGPIVDEVLRELTVTAGVHSDNILRLEALYVDPLEDALWIRMELMTRTLASVIELSSAGLVLSDRVIAGCVKDILAALEALRQSGFTLRNITSRKMLLSSNGALKLTNLSAAEESRDISGAAATLGSLVLDMAGHRSTVQTARGAAFYEFLQMCFNPSVTEFGFQRLIESTFIIEACERAQLAQLVVQCTAFEGRMRNKRIP
ncbi:hypothetical protein C8R46DRAFT_1015115, partial [Mycena filopes]